MTTLWHLIMIYLGLISWWAKFHARGQHRNNFTALPICTACSRMIQSTTSFSWFDTKAIELQTQIPSVSLPEILALLWRAVKQEQTYLVVNEWDVTGKQRGEWLTRLRGSCDRVRWFWAGFCRVSPRRECNRIPDTGNTLINTSQEASRVWYCHLVLGFFRQSWYETWQEGAGDGRRASGEKKPLSKLSSSSRILHNGNMPEVCPVGDGKYLTALRRGRGLFFITLASPKLHKM